LTTGRATGGLWPSLLDNKMPAKDWKAAPAKERIQKIIPKLAVEYDPVCGLNFANPFELLIATILSAQCTDVRVNQVTPVLFDRYPDADAFVRASQEEIEEIIRPTGFFRNKAKSILALCTTLVDQYGGKVPETMDELVALPGIGRKTANVVLGTAFGQPAIMVDTHVKRLANRLHLTQESNPDKIEKDLQALVPEKEQTGFSHRLIWHGRKICLARSPKCPDCVIATYCPEERK
jgi:endonuclease-3